MCMPWSRSWARKVRDTPDDPRGFIFLGRGYLTLNDPGDAAKAFARALTLQQRQHKADPELYSAYAEALTRSASGAVTPDAETAFRSALVLNPRDQAARYYLGLAYASRGQAEGTPALGEPARRYAGIAPALRTG